MKQIKVADATTLQLNWLVQGLLLKFSACTGLKPIAGHDWIESEYLTAE